MKKFIALLIALAMLFALCACAPSTNQEDHISLDDTTPTVNNEIPETTADVVEMDSYIDNSYLTIEVLENLSWNELYALVGELTWDEFYAISCDSPGKLSWTPITDEDIGILTAIHYLNIMGKVFCYTSNARPSFPVEAPDFFDKYRFAEKLDMVLEAFNASDDTYWYVDAWSDINIHLLTGVVESVNLYMTANDELFIKQLKHPPVNGTTVVAVYEGYALSEHPEHFGKLSIYSRDGKCGDILVVTDVITITDMIVTNGDINFVMDYDTDIATVNSMLKLTTLDGTQTFFSWAPHFIPLDVAEPFMPAADSDAG